MDLRYIYNGVELSYSVAGEGDTILLLHGWGCDRNICVATVAARKQEDVVIGGNNRTKRENHQR